MNVYLFLLVVCMRCVIYCMGCEIAVVDRRYISSRACRAEIVQPVGLPPLMQTP